MIEVSDILAVTWTRPDDVFLANPQDTDQVPQWFGLRDGGMLVGFFDGAVRKLERSNNPEDITRHTNT